MQEVSRDIFYQAIKDFEWIPFAQTLAYNLSIVPEDTLHWFIDDEKHPQIGCVGFERRKLGLSMLCIKGECLRENGFVTRKKHVEFYRALHETGFDIYEVNLDTHYSEDAEIALRMAGWLRPVGLFSTTLSKIIPTTIPVEYDKSWKHNLKKAHAASLSFEVKNQIDSSSIHTFLSKHQDLQQHKGFSEQINFEGLQALSKDSCFKMGIIRDASEEILSGCIFYEHPLASTTIYSFSTPQGRDLGASYLLREGIIGYLAQQRIMTLDTGRISPSTHAKNNIFLFKDGMGGEYISYLGEWEYCRRAWMSVLLYFMKQFIWKRVRV